MATRARTSRVVNKSLPPLYREPRYKSIARGECGRAQFPHLKPLMAMFETKLKGELGVTVWGSLLREAVSPGLPTPSCSDLPRP